MIRSTQNWPSCELPWGLVLGKLSLLTYFLVDLHSKYLLSTQQILDSKLARENQREGTTFQALIVLTEYWSKAVVKKTTTHTENRRV